MRECTFEEVVRELLPLTYEQLEEESNDVGDDERYKIFKQNSYKVAIPPKQLDVFIEECNGILMFLDTLRNKDKLSLFHRKEASFDHPFVTVGAAVSGYAMLLNPILTGPAVYGSGSTYEKIFSEYLLALRLAMRYDNRVLLGDKDNKEFLKLSAMLAEMTTKFKRHGVTTQGINTEMEQHTLNIVQLTKQLSKLSQVD